ncbi:hypothetical protein [Streptomyces sp. cg36]|uniref:hypothetical protein n=1 Tax=Streptomyces sp. cg36 TaxID=3238798 RepID=UPI0034E2A8AA
MSTTPDADAAISGLARLRAPFPAEQIHKLPRVWCRDCRQSNFKICSKHTQIQCAACHQKITSAHLHLDYVGHAELTDRLLDADPMWSWEPMAYDERGLPAFDQHGGLWIKLTVRGVTRPGYGDAGDKRGANAIKEAVGDALRNSAMRFGAALNLWAKSDLHAERDTGTVQEDATPTPAPDELQEAVRKALGALDGALMIDDPARRHHELKRGMALTPQHVKNAPVPERGGRTFGELLADAIADNAQHLNDGGDR